MSMVDNAEVILSSAIRLTAPLAFAACGEYLAERAGTQNISVESMMLSGAFGSVAIASLTGNALIGLVGGALVGLVVGLIHGQLSHRLEVNTFVIGLVLNTLALGLTSYLISLADFDSHQVGMLTIPGLSDIPVIGDALFSNRWPMYLLVLIVPLTWWLVERSRWGLELRAIGDNPQACDATGIDVNRRRRQALLWCGLMAGMGGAYLAVCEVGSFNANMTGGRGFLVLAAVIFGCWRLKGALVGCFVFGLADALRLALPALGFELNSQMLIAAPYVLALAAMVLMTQTGREPRSLGQPFSRGLT
ncbi:sugar ABC transporter permease [Rhodococcus rhodochrous]|uniref:ABC transporter permease n=1 Tax=Rhodococcus rhodochrous TaxID=1829 RepID=UPI0009BC7052|nr:ABC transporter permease [Rhodococcus rhodochrous]MDO1485116.1 ABC transporter permease [Rhodococcus rhodochrous]SNV09989.1 sugar ABC transporter permease [Rhodococcus rhodochrous]